MANKVSQLSGGLIARKGSAAPVKPALVKPAPPAVPPAAEPKSKPKGTAGTIAVTVRLDPERYEKLKLQGVRQRRTNQDILVAALDAYLS